VGKTIGEIIERRSDYYFVQASDSVGKVCEYMTDHKVGAVAVQEDDRSCCGVFSERDLLNRVVAKGVNPKSTSVREVMSPDLVTARPEESCRMAAERMKDHETRHLLVLDGNDYLGMVTQSDLTRAFFDEVKEERDLLKHYAFPELPS
jgi:CBS domain-containing protein